MCVPAATTPGMAGAVTSFGGGGPWSAPPRPRPRPPPCAPAMAAARTTKARTAKVRLLLESIEISNEGLLICRSEPCAVGHHARDDRTPLFSIGLGRCGCQLVALLAIPLQDRRAVGGAPLLAHFPSPRPATSR